MTAKGRVFKAESLTKQQAGQLLNSDLVEYQGKQYEVGKIRTGMQKATAKTQAEMQQKASQAQREFVAYRNKFSQEQVSNIVAVNVKISSAAKQHIKQLVLAPGQAPPPPHPGVTEVSVPITPGSRVLIGGSGFGSAPGQAYLQLGTTPIPLTIETWGDNGVLGAIPADIAGVPDGPARVFVKAGGTESNRWPVAFTATREVILMRGPQGMQVDSCGNDAVSNECNINFPSSTFSGKHYAGVLKWKGEGSDTYTATLKNGYSSLDAQKRLFGSGGGVLKGFAPTLSTLRLSFNWSFYIPEDLIVGVFFDPIDILPYLLTTSAVYSVDLAIVGPKGVPYY